MTDTSNFDDTEVTRADNLSSADNLSRADNLSSADNGSRNEQIFGALPESAPTPEPTVIDAGEPATSAQHEESSSRFSSFLGDVVDAVDAIVDQVEEIIDRPGPAPIVSTQGPGGPYEVLFADFTRVLPDNSLRAAIKAELRELLADVTDAPTAVSEAGRLANHKRKWIEALAEIVGVDSAAPGDTPIELELTNLDVQIIARARIRADHLNHQQFLTALQQLPPNDGDIGERGVDFTEVTSPPIASVKFKPGALTFSPTTILPTPAAIPVDLVEAVARERQAPSPRPITVAVIDTGIDHVAREAHPLFAGMNADDPLGGSRDGEIEPSPDGIVDLVYGHGTHVAGIVAARAPLATINHESVRRGTGLSDAFELARDMEDILRASIVVFSFATSSPSEHDIPVLRAVIAHLLSVGKVVVAAAGTAFDLVRPGDSLFPADLDIARMEADLLTHAVLDGRTASVSPNQLISVGAVDVDGVDMPGSRTIDRRNHVKSYGVGVVSAFPAGTVRWGTDGPTETYDGWARWTGTSMAAPRVAGAIAAHYQANPHLSVIEAANEIVQGARTNSDIVE